MSTGRPSPAAVRQLLRLAGATPGGADGDRELVRRFVRDRCEAAFADLMARHGPMVLGVCRRRLRDPHDADDAFQATFLVLARRAGGVRWRESIAGWLFEVATRVSRKAAARRARRTAREGTPADAAPEPVAPAPAADLTALRAALDDELRRLPEPLRTPVVLCHLEGLSPGDVAAHLGITDGQLRGRLYRAKRTIRDRLARRGFSLSAVLLASTVGTRTQALPPVLAATTLHLAAGPPGPVPAAVSALTTLVTQDMTRSVPTLAVAALVAVFALGLGGFAARHATATAPPPEPLAASRAAHPADAPKKNKKVEVERVAGVIQAVYADKNQFVINAEEEDGRAGRTVTVGPGTKVRFGGTSVALADLRPNMAVELAYKGNSTDLLSVRASWPTRDVVVKATDPATNSFSIETGGDEGGFEIVVKVDRAAKVTVDDLPAGVADLPAGARVRVRLSLDKKAVLAVEAEGAADTLPGLVKRYDAATNTLLVEVRAAGFRADRVATVGFPLAAGAKVRRGGRDVAAADLRERMPVRLTFAADRRTVTRVLAADPLPPEVNDDD